MLHALQMASALYVFIHQNSPSSAFWCCSLSFSAFEMEVHSFELQTQINISIANRQQWGSFYAAEEMSKNSFGSTCVFVFL